MRNGYYSEALLIHHTVNNNPEKKLNYKRLQFHSDMLKSVPRIWVMKWGMWGEFYIRSDEKFEIELSRFYLDLITHSVHFSGILIKLFRLNIINYYHCWDQLIEIQDHTVRWPLRAELI